MEGKDIKEKKFKWKISGYDKQEVDDYMLEVSRYVDKLESSNIYLQQELYDKNQQLDEYHGKESTLNRAIVVAQAAADRLKEEAQDEANLIVEKANGEGERLLKSAADEATSIKRETEQLKEVARGYVHQMLGFLNQATDSLKDERFDNLFAANPVQKVDTPHLDEVLSNYDLPVRDGQAADYYDKEESEIDEEKAKQDFFSQNEEQRVQPMDSRAQAAFDRQKAEMDENEPAEEGNQENGQTSDDQNQSQESQDQDGQADLDSEAGENQAELEREELEKSADDEKAEDENGRN